MYSEHLANISDSKSLSDIFYVDKTLYLIHTLSTTQAFNDLKSQRQGQKLTSISFSYDTCANEIHL